MKVFQNYRLFSFDLLDISELCPYEYVRYFFQCNFLHFRAFLLVYITILERDYMEICFYFKYASKNILCIQNNFVVWAPCYITSKKLHP